METRHFSAVRHATMGSQITIQSQGKLRTDRIQLKKAIEQEPSIPAPKVALARLLIADEKRTLSRGGMQNLNQANLLKAMEYLSEARATFPVPGAVIQSEAEIASILSTLSALQGDRERSQQMNQIAHRKFNEYFKYHDGFPVDRPEVLYRLALNSSMAAGQPNLALKYWSRLRQQPGAQTVIDRDLRRKVREAHVLIGEFPQLAAAWSKSLLENPNDYQMLAELERGAPRYGLEREAALLLSELARRGTLPPAGMNLLQGMETR